MEKKIMGLSEEMLTIIFIPVLYISTYVFFYNFVIPVEHKYFFKFIFMTIFVLVIVTGFILYVGEKLTTVGDKDE